MSDEKDGLDLFVAHRQRLVEYATSVMGSSSHSEDIVQEAWLRFSAVTEPAALRHPLRYLFRIVRNIAIDGRRVQTSQGRYLTSEPAWETILSRADDRPASDAEIVHREHLAIVRDAMAELPADVRQAVELHRLEGFKTREVAARLGISLTRAHYLIARGVAHCRQRLDARS